LEQSQDLMWGACYWLLVGLCSY